jgi:hypothetical protein
MVPPSTLTSQTKGASPPDVDLRSDVERLARLRL